MNDIIQPFTLNEWINAIPEEYLHKPIEPEPLDSNGLFYGGAIQMVVARPKQGKTHNVLSLLNKLNRQIIWIDADNNTLSMGEQFENVNHIALSNPCAFVKEHLSKPIKEPTIFVIDSLEKFSCGNNSNDNDGMVNIFKQFSHLKQNGSAVILIHHLKELYIESRLITKLKGNTSVIESNCDLIYDFERQADLLRFKVRVSRIRNIENGTILDINFEEKMMSKIINDICEHGHVNKRDFMKKYKNQSMLINKLIEENKIEEFQEKQTSGQSKIFLKVPNNKPS